MKNGRDKFFTIDMGSCIDALLKLVMYIYIYIYIVTTKRTVKFLVEQIRIELATSQHVFFVALF